MLKLLEKERPRFMNTTSTQSEPVVPLERNLYGHPQTGLLWERRMEQLLFNKTWEQVPTTCGYLHAHRTSILVRLCRRHQDGRKDCFGRSLWEFQRKDTDLEDPTHCEKKQKLINKANFFRRITATEVRNEQRDTMSKILPTDHSVQLQHGKHVETSVERYCELEGKKRVSIEVGGNALHR